MIDWILPPEMSSTLALVLLGFSFASSFITVAFGIGGGAMLLAVMASLVPAAALIPVHGAVQAGSNLGRAMMTLRHIYWQAMPAFIGGSFVGAAIGGAIALKIPPALVQIGVGLFIIWSVLATAPRMIRNWPFTIGAASTFLTMFFGATGPFVATFTKSLSLGRHAHVATHASFMTIQHVVKTAMFGILGFAFAPWIAFTGAMIVAGLAGTILGGRVLNRLSDARFRRALDIVLLIIALRLVYGGVVDLRANGA